jgi:mRNA interferase YafQ
MSTDIFSPDLMTHRLKGDLEGLRSCSCGYDCRIIFSIGKNRETDEEEIVLLNIGKHDEVY